MSPDQHETAAVAALGPHTAQITVRVHPAGTPGLIHVHTSQQGPIELTPGEQIRTLEYAIQGLREQAAGLRRTGRYGPAPTIPDA